jgi:hypothetical protein
MIFKMDIMEKKKGNRARGEKDPSMGWDTLGRMACLAHIMWKPKL